MKLLTHSLTPRLIAAFAAIGIFAAAALLISACVSRTSVVYVTQTPGAADTGSASTPITTEGALVASSLPTDMPTDMPTVEPTLEPTPLPTEPPTQVAVAPTLPPTLPPTADPLTPSATFMGSVVGSDYTLPPTFAPAATVTAAGDAAVTDSSAPPPATGVSTPGTAVIMPNLDPERIGVQLDINLSQDDWNDAMGRIETLGVRWIKVQISWRDMQPNGPDERDNDFFRLAEQHLEDAARRGFSVMVSVAKAPLWARSNPAEDGPPDDPQAFANFVSLLLNEINAGLARPQLGDYIDAIELWNEPNLIREWQGTLPFTGEGYMRMFAPAYAAVRAYSPTMPIITAGLAPTGNTPGLSVDDRDYLRQMYTAGLGQYADVAVGIHPYSWGNSPDAVCCPRERGWDDDPHFFFADTMREYRAIMDENGHNAAMLYITEFGYATWDGLPGDPPPGSEWMRQIDRYQQGLYTIRALEIVQGTPNLGPVMLWNLNFGVLAGLIDNRDERVAYSLIVPGSLGTIIPGSADRTERPLFWMIYDAVRPDTQLPSF